MWHSNNPAENSVTCPGRFVFPLSWQLSVLYLGTTGMSVVITEGDDMKFDPFGTSALSSLASYDWSDRDESLPGEVRKPQGLEGASLPSLLPTQRKELAFGSTENITSSSAAKIPPSLTTDDGSSADDKFEAFADFGPSEQGGGIDDEDDFGDFASTVSEKSDSPAATAEVGSEGNQSEASDEFGAFQGDKPKFGKSDFLKASTQAKVKSSEEMIKNELATFDLSVQGKLWLWFSVSKSNRWVSLFITQTMKLRGWWIYNGSND